MARCEDFPCCGHEPGCCPDFDPETGKQLNMVCTCGAKLPISNGCSICDACLRRMDIEDGIADSDFGSDDHEPYDIDDPYDREYDEP